MARGRSEVWLYDKHSTPMFRIPRTLARTMKSTGEAYQACLRCSTVNSDRKTCEGTKPHNWVYVVTDIFRIHFQSSCSLREADILGNVGMGMGKGSRDISQQFARASRDKILAWPFIYDSLAPLAQ